MFIIERPNVAFGALVALAALGCAETLPPPVPRPPSCAQGSPLAERLEPLCAQGRLREALAAIEAEGKRCADVREAAAGLEAEIRAELGDAERARELATDVLDRAETGKARDAAERAVELLDRRQRLAEEGSEGQARRLLGEADEAMREERWRRAAWHYERAWALFPPNPPALAMAGIAVDRAGDAVAAQRLFERLRFEAERVTDAAPSIVAEPAVITTPLDRLARGWVEKRDLTAFVDGRGVLVAITGTTRFGAERAADQAISWYRPPFRHASWDEAGLVLRPSGRPAPTVTIPVARPKDDFRHGSWRGFSGSHVVGSNGEVVAVGTWGGAELWSIEGDKLLTVALDDLPPMATAVTGLALSVESGLLAVGTHARVVVVRIDDGEAVFRLDLVRDELLDRYPALSGLALSPTGTRLAVVTAAHQSVWDLVTGQRVGPVRHLPGAASPALSTTGAYLELDAVTGRRIFAIDREEPVLSGVPIRSWGDDDSWICGEDPEVFRFDPKTGERSEISDSSADQEGRRMCSIGSYLLPLRACGDVVDS